MRKGYRRRPPAPPVGTPLHTHVLRDGVVLAVMQVRTPSGPRYCVHDHSEVIPLDDGFVYGTYEEAAAVYTRVILDDGDDVEFIEVGRVR